MSIQSQTRTFKNVTFTSGENDSGIFWEHRTKDGINFLAQKSKGCWWWVLYAIKSKQITTLNCSLTDHSGALHNDPLYREEHRHAPLGINYWLEQLAHYINQHSDPFNT